MVGISSGKACQGGKVHRGPLEGFICKGPQLVRQFPMREKLAALINLDYVEEKKTHGKARLVGELWSLNAI